MVVYLLVWQHEVFSKMDKCVSPNPSVWQLEGVILSTDIYAGKGHPLEGVCTTTK